MQARNKTFKRRNSVWESLEKRPENGVELGNVEMGILQEIAKYGKPFTSFELRARMMESSASTNVALRKLRKQKLVKVVSQQGDDVVVELTAKGRVAAKGRKRIRGRVTRK